MASKGRVRRWGLMAALVVVVALVGACGGGAGSAGDAASTATAAPVAEAASAEVAAAPTEAAAESDTEAVAEEAAVESDAEETATEEVAAEEVVTEEVATETPVEEAAAEEAATEEVAAEEVVTEAPAEGAATEGGADAPAVEVAVEAPSEEATGEADAEDAAAGEGTAGDVADDAAGEAGGIVEVPAVAVRSTEAAAGTLLVDAGVDRGAISPLVYGANTGPLWVLMPAVWERATALDLGVIHFPGGEWGDQNVLTEKQIDDFKALSDRLGAEPFISVQLPHGDPANAAAHVEYANIEMGYDIKYWAIGNEPNLYPPRYGEEWTPEHYAAQWRIWAEAMKAVDPTIQIMGPEVTGFVGEGEGLNEWQASLSEWVRVFLEVNGDLVDIVSIHRYPFPFTGGTMAESATVEQLLLQPREMDGRVLPDLRRMIHEITGRDIPVAITEYGLDSRNIIRGETAPNAPLSALWWGDSLARVIDQGVEMINYWNLTARDAQGGHGIFTQFAGRPVYHTFKMFSLFGDNLVSADAGNEDVFALASLREDGALTVILSNTSQEEQTLAVDLQGFAGETVEAWRVLGEVEGMTEIEETLVGGEDVVLPAMSLTLFVLGGE